MFKKFANPRLLPIILFATCLAWTPALIGQEETDDPYESRRDRLVDSLTESGFGKKGIEDENVLEAMRATPRHKFVPDRLVTQAYRDTPLPIGHGQTISQPYIVAYMTDMLDVDEDDVVLEIGTGSGYQAAVLSEIVKEVYTIEIIEPLGEQAKKVFDELGYDNIHAKIGDGYFGWEDHAPYDGIIVTAAASHVPPPLVEQLKPGAKMVIPVGPPFQVQNLMLVEKNEDGTVRQRNVMPVRFVPLTRGEE